MNGIQEGRDLTWWNVFKQTDVGGWNHHVVPSREAGWELSAFWEKEGPINKKQSSRLGFTAYTQVSWHYFGAGRHSQPAGPYPENLGSRGQGAL